MERLDAIFVNTTFFLVRHGHIYINVSNCLVTLLLLWTLAPYETLKKTIHTQHQNAYAEKHDAQRNPWVYHNKAPHADTPHTTDTPHTPQTQTLSFMHTYTHTQAVCFLSFRTFGLELKYSTANEYLEPGWQTLLGREIESWEAPSADPRL